MNGLNKKQEEACSYTEGPLLILAGAGSGKTRVLTHRIAYLINEKSVAPYNILAITFTNKAAKEMRERVDKIVGMGSEEIWVSTFHSMCVRILRRFNEKRGGTNNFTIYDTDDQKTVIKETLKYLGLDEKRYPVKAMISAISKAKEEFLDPEQFERTAGASFYDLQVAKVYHEYQKRMRQNNAMDFDDLIFNTIQLFTFQPDILKLYQERFKYIMVDEYQDTNHTQFLLVKMLASKYRNLCVVGDDDQSIYKFRGANIENILSFEDVYPDAKVVKLEQNYRSTANILNAANGVIANNEGRKDKSLWTENEDGERVFFTRYENEREEALGVADQMIADMNDGALLNDMAVLYRTNAQSRVIEERLIRANIPYRLVGGTNFYARKEIRDIVGYLKCIANPDDDVSLERIINVPRRGIGNATIEKLADFAEGNGINLYDAIADSEIVPGASRAVAKLNSFYEMMEEFKREAFDDETSLLELYNDILDKTGYMAELKADTSVEARTRVENLEEFRNKITDYEKSDENPTLTGLLEDVALVADADKDDDPNSDKVTLMTLHSAKGLEFPYVYMVGMEERLFPSGMSLDSDDPDAAEEERRLCYVGITRAMKKLYMSAAKSRMVNGITQYPAVSRFVKEIPKNLIRYRGLSMEDRDDSYERDTAGGYGFGSSRGSFGNRDSYGSSNTYYDDYQYDRPTSFRKPKRTEYTGKKLEKPHIYGLSKGMPEKVDLDYTVGDTVKHIKFGKGVVTELIQGGNDYEVTVDFESAGEKKMFASLARLRKI